MNSMKIEIDNDFLYMSWKKKRQRKREKKTHFRKRFGSFLLLSQSFFSSLLNLRTTSYRKRFPIEPRRIRGKGGKEWEAKGG